MLHWILLIWSSKTKKSVIKRNKSKYHVYAVKVFTCFIKHARIVSVLCLLNEINLFKIKFSFKNQENETEEEFPVVIPDDNPKYTMSLISQVQVSKENNKISCILPHTEKFVL